MKNRDFMLFGVLLIAGIVIVSLAMNGWQVPFMGQKSVVGEGSVFTPDGQEIKCESGTTPQKKINAYDVEDSGTPLTEATNLYRRGDQKAWSTFTLGTAFPSSGSLQVGKTYEYVIGITTTDMTDNAYGSKGEFVATCEEEDTMEVALFQDEVETSITATFLNDNHDASAQAFNAGEVLDIYVKLKAGTDEYFGNPYLPTDVPNVICVNLNDTAFKKPQKVSIHEGYKYSVDANGDLEVKSLKGQDLNKVSAPSIHDGEAGHTTYCYEAPVIGDSATEIVMTLEADSSAPIIDETLNLYAGNWFVDEDSSINYGVEDEDGAFVGTDAGDSLTLDFTA